MKTTYFVIRAITLLLIIIIVKGCLEYDITTKVYSDGRVERIFMVKGDSAGIYNSTALMLPEDSSWDISTWWELDDSTKNNPDSIFVFLARKTFKNYKELNTEIASESYNEINVKASLKKRFRWFYTDITYKETYQQFFPFHHFSYDNYISEDELRYIISADKGKDEYMFHPGEGKFIRKQAADTSVVLDEIQKARAKEVEKDIERRLGQWHADNIFEEYFIAMQEGLKDKDIGAYRSLNEKRTELHNVLELNDMFNLGDEKKKYEENLADLILKTLDYTGIDSTNVFGPGNQAMQDFFRKLSFSEADETFVWYTYRHKLVMPGVIIHTNTENRDMGDCIWEFAIRDFYAHDFEMVSESRIVNKWAIVISIIVVTALLAGLVSGFIKKA